MAKEKPERFWTVEQLYKQLGYKSKVSMYGAIERGKFPCVRVGRKILIPQSLLDRWIAEQNPQIFNTENAAQ